ncbi:MAG: carbon-nitrogen hydrolase family protein [Planctomycetes bacterium]|nr:carbon-nitrogen hydrolase family protein [Planctomycetota bacterium]
MVMPAQSAITLKSCKHWAPREAIAPKARRDKDGFVVASNGSEGCYGGWELAYPLPKSPWVRVSVTARPQSLAYGLDSVHAALVWEGQHAAPVYWEPLLPTGMKDGSVTYGARAQKPATAKGLLVRLLMAWSRSGEIRWSKPEVMEAGKPKPRRWRLGAAGGPLPAGERTIKTNTEAYLGMCRRAAAQNVDLLCLPEVMLVTGMPSNPETIPQQAIPVPGKEIEPFRDFARKNKVALCFSAWEKNAEMVHNTAILIDKRGELVGKYRKVHLASPLEVWWGVTPGHEFPVYELHGARVAMNICMDSSALESARVPARLGAEILCMPIMGDHRAVSKWDVGQLDFDLDRWVAIQRVRAMDNQLYMVISRNNGYGTGVFSPRGEVLALSGGAQLVHADVDLEDLPRTWTGATFRGVAWWERREPTYGPLMGR